MNVTRRGFLSSIVLACAGARKLVQKKFAWDKTRMDIIYSQDMRVPYYDGGNGIDVTPAQVFERRVRDVERKHVNDAIPYLMGHSSALRTTKTGQRVGGRQRRQGGRARGVERG